MADLKERLRAMFEEDGVPSGLREEVLAEVLLTDRSSHRYRLAWIGAAAMAAIVVAALLIFRVTMLHPQDNPAKRPTPAPSPSVSAQPTPTPSQSPSPSPSTPPSVAPSPAGPAAGPYTTLAAAESYVTAQPPFARYPATFIATDRTWRPSGTLQVVRATGGSASYQGDYFYFFVAGNPVGNQYFTRTENEVVVADDTFAVAYSAYLAGDAHCCPSGGSRTVRFHWNGTRLVPLDPLNGATQS